MGPFYRERMGAKIAVGSSDEVRLSLPSDASWQAGEPLFDLAAAWVGAERGHFPAAVERVLASDPTYRGHRIAEAVFEKEVDLRSYGTPGRLHLLVRAAAPEDAGDAAVIGVAAKGAEAFGQRVEQWRDSVGKERRLNTLCKALGLATEPCAGLRYRFIHHAAATVFEAERQGVARALYMVQCFAPGDPGFDEFQAFARAIGAPVEVAGRIGRARGIGGVALSLAWVPDPR